VRSLARFDPLRITGTALPPAVLLACKLLALSLILRGYVPKLPEPFLPIVRVFEHVPRPDLFRQALVATFLVAATALVLNVCVRTSAFFAGLVFVLEPLVSRVAFYYGNFFCGAILLLSALIHSPLGVRIVQGQFLVMYFGSGLNKLLDPDWRNGHYFQYWMGGRSARYDLPASWLPEGAFALFMSWSTIAIELSLPFLLARRRTFAWGVWLAILFHVGSMLVAKGDFGIFVSAILFSFVVFGEWPEPGTARLRHAGTPAWRAARALGRLADRDRLVAWGEAPLPRAELAWPGRTYRGAAALNRLVLLLPASYFAFLLLITTPRFSYRLGNALAARGLGWFEDDRLIHLHWRLVELLTVGLVVWFFPGTRWLLERLRGGGRARLSA
jgi:hypothetical protein